MSTFRMLFLLLLVIVSTPWSSSEPLWNDVCSQEPTKSLPFCDTNLSLEDRVLDYITRVPIESQINMTGNQADPYEPLGIPAYNWWSEGLHGPLEPCVSYGGTCHCPTSFPCPSALANAFNASLYQAIGTAIGQEGRAISKLRPHDMSNGDGLTYWSPVINMQRDPRWGRNQEAPGEDPHLTGVYAKAYVHGLQGSGDANDPLAKIRVGAACKHFVANSLENWKGVTRHDFDAHVTPEDLWNYYFPPFRDCVQQAAGVMCSYNALNGIPACTNQWLLRTILREEWDFRGYITTDCGALGDVVHGHHAAVSPAQAAAQAIEATVDTNCGNGEYYPKGLYQAWKDGMAPEQDIRDSFARLATIQFRLGLFDHPKPFDPDADIATVGSHEKLSLDAALQSIVLLKNQNNLLPLSPDMKLAVIGPHIHAKSILLSNYHGGRCSCDNRREMGCIQTPLEALQQLATSPITAIEGCHVVDSDLNEIPKVTEIARDADAVVLLMGLNLSVENEGLDRINTTLPGLQHDLVDAVLKVAAKKTVLILLHGGSMSIGDAWKDQIPAIVSASYGGEAGSEAIAQVIYDQYNPTGKLAATMYPPSYVDEIPMTEMGLSVGVGRTYLYYTGDPEFPFGHGLSYSDWGLQWQNNSPLELNIGASNHAAVIQVTNLGPVTGSQTVLLFWKPPSNWKIRKKLIGFQGSRLLEVGDSDTLEFQIGINQFELWDVLRNTTVVSSGDSELEAVAANGAIVRRSLRILMNSGSSITAQR